MPVTLGKVRAEGQVLRPLLHVDGFFLTPRGQKPIHRYPVVALATRIVVHLNDLDPGLLDLAVFSELPPGMKPSTVPRQCGEINIGVFELAHVHYTLRRHE